MLARLSTHSSKIQSVNHFRIRGNLTASKRRNKVLGESKCLDGEEQTNKINTGYIYLFFVVLFFAFYFSILQLNSRLIVARSGEAKRIMHFD